MPRHPERFPARERPASGRVVLSAVAAAIAILLLSGCTPPVGPSAPTSSTSATPSTPTPTTTPTADPDPVLVPDGTAHDNLPLFAAITAAVWASPDSVAGRAYIDALAAAGFDKAAMQVTQDLSTVGNPAESIQFSVRWGDECLVGQVGPAIGEPHAVVVPVLAEGTCLIGQTRPIDW